ncbi:TlpA family protein disulfide reductase [Pedobacter nyackensis]|uniref:Thiol-disulfide isomerase or thioredoxin n=1 Tax=Pedobacter nyackensis TaxID=475255 RepID=A0A1W2CQ96_9SPHI|nr:TlpA disulfide reductase family protein [Pedobacter nyackensis]SMC87389.1 Thiol-disulfide isomerase or thioredoxin [Pedobacter nyackensis]
MKKILMLAALLLTKASFAQMSEIRGVMKNGTQKDISLFSVVDGKPELMANTQLGEDGSFGFLFTPANEGFYAVGYARMEKGSLFPLYMKKGDKSEIAIDKRRMQFVGKQTPENTVLSSWTNLTQELKVKSIYFMESPLSTYHDFFPELTKVAAQTDAFRKTIKTKNENFNRLMTSVTYFDMDYYAMHFVRTPRKEHPKKEDYPSYYKTIIAENKFKNDDVLSTLFGEFLMNDYADYAVKGNIQDRLKLFSTDRQKGVYTLFKMIPHTQNYPQYEGLVKNFGQYFASPSLKKRVEELGAKLYITTAGGNAVDFTFPDQNGKMVSLSDFKGKVVVMDIWATWCNPCTKEIPYLKKLEEEFHGKDVVFISLGVDELKDKDKWSKYVENQKLTGVQLYAGGFVNKVTDFYKIETIPRFIVIDKNGKLLNPNSPRPSDPKLKALLEGELAKAK